MKKSWLRKNVVYVLILLFVGASVIPNISGGIGIKNKSEQIGRSTTDWWPMFRHDPGNTAYSLSKAPEEWVEYWKYQTTEFIIGSPVITNGKLYIGTLGDYKRLNTLSEIPILLQPLSENGSLLCIDAADGSLIWEHSSVFIITSPAVDYGKVFFSYLVNEDEGKIACLNAETGNQLWEKSIYYFITSPIISAGNVYVASSGVDVPMGTIYCLNATTGNQLWTYTPSIIDYISCSPAILNGKLYCVHDSMTGIYVSCLNAVTGQLIWDVQMTTDTSIQSFSIAAASDTIVVAAASYDGTYGKVYALNPTNGNDIWSYQTDEWYTQWPDIVPSLTITYNKVYFITMLLSSNSVIYCLDLDTGIELWTMDLGDISASSPSIADEKMYFTTVGGLIYCLNTTDGDFIWSTYFKGGVSSPSIANETIFAVDNPGTIYAYGAPREPEIPTIEGPVNGKIKTIYNYTFLTTDLQGNDIFYYIDWGDGQSENWVGPYGSDEQVLIGHTWSKRGSYLIKAKAKDIYDFESDWGTLSVKMPCSYNIPLIQFWGRLLERFPNAFPILHHILRY